MPIKNATRVLQRLMDFTSSLEPQYKKNDVARDELKKLIHSFDKLLQYLTNLENLQSNFNTSEITSSMQAINLHLDILKGELDIPDYTKLRKGTNAAESILRFHPQHYTFFQFILAWFYELSYFI